MRPYLLNGILMLQSIINQHQHQIYTDYQGIVKKKIYTHKHIFYVKQIFPAAKNLMGEVKIGLLLNIVGRDHEVLKMIKETAVFLILIFVS